ncbi:WYL domain-containing protein [Paenibacillus sp. R14(2021)]|uniref:WYL domain-containing protein n=1 Tax=Paenibacillus sp. R14(2021) TaxID=2859228 RepID=UPI001C615461|nr:WYL domain-containing protein [Paenibacillus sp. R14(2021)]
MNPFEKIFNYQVVSRLSGSGTFMVTSHERAWLKLMLQHPAAVSAFAPETLAKLQYILQEDDALTLEAIFEEKARSREKQVYHPLLRPLRRCIAAGSGVLLSYFVKDEREFSRQQGVPYKLEYSMVKREWYLLWYNLRQRSFMSTKLAKMTAAEELKLAPERFEQAMAFIAHRQERVRQTALIEVVPDYNRELSRILYAFSCFEKSVDYDEDAHVYTVKLTFGSDESEYVLSKIHFLGKRVRIAEGDYLRKRMLESSRKALERYGVKAVEAEEDLIG